MPVAKRRPFPPPRPRRTPARRPGSSVDAEREAAGPQVAPLQGVETRLHPPASGSARGRPGIGLQEREHIGLLVCVVDATEKVRLTSGEARPPGRIFPPTR